MTIFEEFGAMNSSDMSQLVQNRSVMVDMLVKHDIMFAEAYDRKENSSEIIINSDIDNKVVTLRYDSKDQFVSLSETLADFDSFVGVFVSAYFHCGQYPFVTYHRGENTFPLSQFELDQTNSIEDSASVEPS